jgi:aromatase
MSGHTDAAVVINAAMDLVWKMTNDVASWPQLFTEYSSVELLGQDGETLRFRLTMHPDENGTAHSWVSERTPDPVTRSVRARRIEGGVFEYMNIFWEYGEVDDGVQMRWTQDFHVRDEMPFGDEQMADHLSKNTATQMAHIKEQVEKAAAGE